jgi:hypothetical protein
MSLTRAYFLNIHSAVPPAQLLNRLSDELKPWVACLEELIGAPLPASGLRPGDIQSTRVGVTAHASSVATLARSLSDPALADRIGTRSKVRPQPRRVDKPEASLDPADFWQQRRRTTKVETRIDLENPDLGTRCDGGWKSGLV